MKAKVITKDITVSLKSLSVAELILYWYINPDLRFEMPRIFLVEVAAFSFDIRRKLFIYLV